MHLPTTDSTRVIEPFPIAYPSVNTNQVSRKLFFGSHGSTGVRCSGSSTSTSMYQRLNSIDYHVFGSSQDQLSSPFYWYRDCLVEVLRNQNDSHSSVQANEQSNFVRDDIFYNFILLKKMN